MYFLRFDDKATREARNRRRPDRLCPIRDFFDAWHARLGMCYNPSRELCVDEQLVQFKGRCGFAQYIPSKPGKVGLKLWVCCDVATSYAVRVQVAYFLGCK